VNGRIVVLLTLPLLVSCSTTGSRGGLAEPITIDDLQPLPDEVTNQNARLVIRRALQAHRHGNDYPDEEYGYIFRESGFVQIYHRTPLDRAEERVSRTFVEYASVRSARGEPYFDFQRLKERYRVTLSGTFRRWEAPVIPSRPQPELGSEPSLHPVESLSLALEDPVMAKKLSDALLLLSAR
jgi:hypothetical protein